MDIESKRVKDVSKENNLMWIEKYRPTELEEIISHDHILNTIQRLIIANQLPHLLFYGPPGTGKTTTALAVAKQLNKKYWRSMTLELNASDERGIGVVRNRIKTFASTQQMFHHGLKLVILDEADAMTRDAQFALRRIMEQYTKNTRFILIGNYVNKIIPAIQSRCTRFRFSPLESEALCKRLQEICIKEAVNLVDGTLETIIDLANGDMRRCLNILQSTHMAYGVVDSGNVHVCTGTPDPKHISLLFRKFFKDSFQAGVETMNRLMDESGVALADILQFLHPYVIRTEMHPEAKSFLLMEMGELEHRLSHAATAKVQSTGLVSIFHIAKAKMLQNETQI